MIVRCTGEGWTAYFYDTGPSDGSTDDLRSNIYRAVLPKADHASSWGPNLPATQPPQGEWLPTVVRLPAGQPGSTAIYWEPPGRTFEAAIAGLVLGRSFERILEVWRNYAR